MLGNVDWMMLFQASNRWQSLTLISIETSRILRSLSSICVHQYFHDRNLRGPTWSSRSARMDGWKSNNMVGAHDQGRMREMYIKGPYSKVSPVYLPAME